MSKPRPIHREIRSIPDDAEPSFSYEQESFMAAREDDVEDEFHRRLAGNRRESSGSHGGGGSSFWRTTSDNKTEGAAGVVQTPSFSSMNMNKSETTPRAKERKSSGLLGAALQSHAQNGELHEEVSKRVGSSLSDFVEVDSNVLLTTPFTFFFLP